MKVLMSIKPEYVEKIFSGEKEWEIRRIAPQPFCKNAMRWRPSRSVFGVVVYASSPIRKVVGELMIDYTILGNTKQIMEECGNKVGIDFEILKKYLYDPITEEDDMAWGMHIGWKRLYEKPLTLDEARFILKKSDSCVVTTAPQNFCYINDFKFKK